MTAIKDIAEIQLIKVAHIIPGENDREAFDAEGLRELAESIQQHGLAQPITVRPIGFLCPYCWSPATDQGPEYRDQPDGHRWYRCSNDRCAATSTTRSVLVQYQIVAGERRWRAVKSLECAEIPAIVRELDEEAASAIILLESIHRVELNPI